MKSIKLELSGPGTLYPTHVGAILCLTEAGYEIKEVCGSSGGAIVAAALATGYASNSELVKFIKKTLPSKHGLIKKSFWSLFSDYSVVSMNKLDKYFDDYLVSKFDEAKIPLYVAVTELTSNQLSVFSHLRSPKEKVSRVVMASMALPILFKPVKIGDVLCVDGCTAPQTLKVFDEEEGVVRVRAESAHVTPVISAGIKPVVSAALNSFIQSKNQEHIPSAQYKQTIRIKSSYPCFDLNCTDSDVDKMIAEGYKAAEEWLKTK